MNEQSSASMSIDPDRIVIEQFEDGTTSGQSVKKIEKLLVPEEDPFTCATFAIRQEDHTLGNLLRHVIMQDPDVEFCGYSQPHPSESKIHLRIQSKNPLRSAVDILQQSLQTVIEMAKHTIQTWNKAVDQQNYRTTQEE